MGTIWALCYVKKRQANHTYPNHAVSTARYKPATIVVVIITIITITVNDDVDKCFS